MADRPHHDVERPLQSLAWQNRQQETRVILPKLRTPNANQVLQRRSAQYFQYDATLAETERFELSVPFKGYDALAKRWFQPLTHVSGSSRGGL